jgi:DNA mismatch endonuclease (patch repair protein)
MPFSRSEVMARITGKDTRPELAFRRGLFRRGRRFRIHFHVHGICRVDVAFPRQRVAIQIDGCFWHGCPIHAVRPKTNSAFWDHKIRVNRARDQRQDESLKSSGWLVLRFWEHEIEDQLEAALDMVDSTLEFRSMEAPNLRTKR